MDTLTKSCSPTTIIIANGEVQTHEEATAYVKELDIFLTVKVLDNTPAVLSLEKLYGEHGFTNGPTLWLLIGLQNHLHSILTHILHLRSFLLVVVVLLVAEIRYQLI